MYLLLYALKQMEKTKPSCSCNYYKLYYPTTGYPGYSNTIVVYYSNTYSTIVLTLYNFEHTEIIKKTN